LLEEAKSSRSLAVGFAAAQPADRAQTVDLYDPAVRCRRTLRRFRPCWFSGRQSLARAATVHWLRGIAEEACEVIRADASLTFTDTQIGRVMAELDRLKLRDKTVIILFGDHGYHLGEKGKWSKHNSVFEIAARVPMMVCLPGGAAGKSSREP
jgi:arylsulfatase A-like enzyme